MPPHKTSSDSSADTAPAALGYRMPAEWEPHAATWLAWPHYQGDWPGKFEPIPWVYAEIIRNLAKHERVELIVNDALAARRARSILGHANAWSENIRFHHWPTNRVWVRDSGCIFVNREGHEFTRAEKRQTVPGALAPEVVALKFRFNAWAKYSNWRYDDKIGSLMSKVTVPTLFRKERERRVGQPTRAAGHAIEVRPTSRGKPIVLEGGSIDVNGVGTILTTEECLLSRLQQRNPHMKRVHYEQAFSNYLGASHTIWLERGIVGDDTHGHVDDLARFVSKDTVVTMVEPDTKDANHSPLRANLWWLHAARDQDGQQLTVVEIPMPQPVVFQGRRLPASYANFYIANGVVLVPVFNCANDRIALNTLAEVFPDREIIPIYSGDLIWGLGAMHCMTQQQPA
jgi:agmatine deiminase